MCCVVTSTEKRTSRRPRSPQSAAFHQPNTAEGAGAWGWAGAFQKTNNVVSSGSFAGCHHLPTNHQHRWWWRWWWWWWWWWSNSAQNNRESDAVWILTGSALRRSGPLSLYLALASRRPLRTRNYRVLLGFLSTIPCSYYWNGAPPLDCFRISDRVDLLVLSMNFYGIVLFFTVFYRILAISTDFRITDY